MKHFKFITIVLIVLSVVLSAFSLGEAVTPENVTEVFESGSRAEANGLKIVSLHGTWHDMGRQYGYLLSGELHEVADMSGELIRVVGEDSSKVHTVLETQHAQMPFTYRSFFEGMAETSGLTVEELERANSVERLAALPRCSFAAVWGDYAAGSLVLGRNYDYDPIFNRLDKDVVITVYHPADGSLAVATVGYAGEIYAVNALNEAGVFIELNNGTFSSKLKSPVLRITGTTQLLEMMFRADSLELLDVYFATALNSSAYIVNAADSRTVHSYEWCTVGMQRGDGTDSDGVFASTNHYISPDWTFEAPDEKASLQTTQRRANLLKLCEDRKGAIDCEAMREIISVPLEEGGAFNPLTVYQLVVEPESRTIFLKTAGQDVWTEFDAGAFLDK